MHVVSMIRTIFIFVPVDQKGSTVTVDGPGDPCGESRKYNANVARWYL